MQVAIEKQHIRILNNLLSAGCTFDYESSVHSLSPLSLLRASTTPTDRQPLFLIVQYEDLDMFKSLLSRYHR